MSDKKPSQTFDIRKIYLKDASLESPAVPDIFLETNSRPEISVDVAIAAKSLEQKHYYEVVLHITVTSKAKEETAFLIEVQQAGVFHIEGFANEDLKLALEIACPNVLLPFAREAVSDFVTKAGFPQLLLAPINFESLYIQKKKQAKDAEDQTKH